MPRTARIVIPGVAHHVTQRGNNRQDVFFVDDDRRFYLEILRHQATRWGVRLLGYCLMASSRLRTSTHTGRTLDRGWLQYLFTFKLPDKPRKR